MGTDLWRRAIEKEIQNVRPAFERWDSGTIDDAREVTKLVGFKR